MNANHRKLISSYILTPEDMDYAEYCYFNMSAYQELLTYVLLIRDEYNAEYSKENYEHFLKEYKESRQKYYLCLRNLLSNYAPSFLYSQIHDIELNFEELKLNIYLKNGDPCSCDFEQKGE